MTKEALMRAKEIEEELEDISTEILPRLDDIYEELVEYQKRGKTKVDADFCFDRMSVYACFREAPFTVKNAINFVKAEMKIVTEHKVTLEKELKEL